MVWTHNINPIALSVGPVEIRWYGVMYVLAFLFTWWYIRQRAKSGKIPLTLDQVESSLTWLVVSMLIGARLGAVLFYYPGYYLQHPLEIFAIWQGGLSFHGGMIGILIACYFFTKKYKMTYWEIADAFIVPLAFAQAFGRIGNFINGELWGNPTLMPWGMIFPLSGDLLSRHPSQLYEVAYNLVIGVIIYVNRDRVQKAGWLFGLWAVLYAVARFTVEFFRAPEVMVGPITMGQLLTIPVLILGIWLMLRKPKDTHTT